MNRKLVYVLAASDYGPMIVSRLDYDPRRQGMGVGACVLEFGDHQINEVVAAGQILHALRNTRGNGVTVIDGGANVGSHTLAWANLMRGWGTITAVEPQERVYYALCGNIALNNCTNAKAVKAVIGAEPGEMEIPEWDQEIAHNSGGCHMNVECDPGAPPKPHRVKIKVMQIDALKLTRLDFLKLDIEGMEPQALAGAGATIRRCKPIIQAEHLHCGWNTIKLHVGDDYEFIPAGVNVVCVPKGDPVLEMFEKTNETPRILLSPD